MAASSFSIPPWSWIIRLITGILSASPGWVFTDWQVKQYFTGEVEVKNLNYLAQVQSLGLKINGEDIANHILFYLSDVSRASTGHNCVVDAGWTLE